MGRSRERTTVAVRLAEGARCWRFAPLLLLAACELTTPQRPAADKRVAALARAEAARLKRACGSQAGYDRLKSMAFVEAGRIRRADSPALKRLASLSVVRMDQPVPRARDAALGVTVCSGRFVLELPPGAERLFAGDRRLEANVEYAAQDAADGSGPVYQMKGAEPIIYRLAAVGLRVREPVLLGGSTGAPAFAPVARPIAAARPPALVATPAPVPPSIRPEPKPLPSPLRVAGAPPPTLPIKGAIRPKTTERVAPSGAGREAKAVAQAPRTAKPANVAVKVQKGSKTKMPSRVAAVRPKTPDRVATKRDKAPAAAVKLAMAKMKPTKAPAAPVRLAAKERSRPAPVRLAAAKPPAIPVTLAADRPRVATIRLGAAKPRVVPAKLTARLKARPVLAVASRPLAKRPPVRLAAQAATPVRVAGTRAMVRPTFGCDDAPGRVERLICEDPWLARADRAMTAAFYRAMDDADPDVRRQLLRTRAAFLAYRDRCPSARCVADAYADRIDEIRDIAADRY